MKNLNSILGKSNMTPFERVRIQVHDQVHKAKTGKGILSVSDRYAITEAWSPSASEGAEYCKYILISRTETAMQMDAQLFLYQAEVAILRYQRILEEFLPRERKIDDLAGQPFSNPTPAEECVRFLTQHTYLPYEQAVHTCTFHNLSKEIQSDLLLLDEEIKENDQYLKDQVFLYEQLGNGGTLSKQDKDLIVSRVYSCMYYEGAKRIKKSTAEKDGFLLHAFFAELPIKALFQKLVDDAHITSDTVDVSTDEGLLSLVEEYARNKNTSIERLVKEKLSQWLDDGLFVKEYPALFMSEQFDTWNGSTKMSHKELFIAWYTELQKSKQLFQMLFSTNQLEKKHLETEFFGMPRTVEIITGTSLYACKEEADFVQEYKKQIETLLPIANAFLRIKKYIDPVKNYRTLCEFKKLAQKVSTIFDIDMTERYTEYIDSYLEEMTLLDAILNRLPDIANEHLHVRESLKYIIDIDDCCFTFDLDEEGDTANIVKAYADELEKIAHKTYVADIAG